MKRKGIKIDKNTINIIQNLTKTIQEAQSQIALIGQVYLNSKRIKGSYMFSQDGTTLIPHEDEKPHDGA